jgi:nucleoside-diphosphate-sugar epimerase
VIGRQLVPLLTSVGHEVVGLARSERRAADLRRAGGTSGARPGAERPIGGASPAWRSVTADALDRAAVTRAVREAAPDAVVHLLTAIPDRIDSKRLARDFELTNRLRAEGTRNLLDAAADVGVRRVVTQGLAYVYEPADGLADEDAPLWREPPAQFVPVLGALGELEWRTHEAGGLVLRFGHLYGPGTAFAADGPFTAMIRAGKVPVVGGGTATFSFTHTHDAATAIAAALDKDVAGALNVVDDDPAPVSEWLPAVAEMLGARKPGRVPAALARFAVGGWGVAFMTQLRGADNTRAKLHLDWRPRYSSWRHGFADELAGSVVTAA